MESIDPDQLDFARLAQVYVRADQDAWRAAGAHGVDLLLLERNLALTPAERMQQLEEALRLMGR
jgi:predicted DsbA family dithiol-disulfide isomerase